MKEILNLGAGVQSSCVLLMSCLGELPKLDAAIFADTCWEPAAVYRHLRWLERYAQDHGIPVHRVSKSNIREDALRSQVRGRVDGRGKRWASMPYFTLQADGSRGMIKRQCTKEYKIEPIESFIKRELLGIPKGKRLPKEIVVTQWFGISFDERRRVRLSSAAWTDHWYPLVEARTTRAGCLEWMESHGFPRPPRSACIGCPFHCNAEWREIKRDPDDWEDVVEFDRAIRNCGGTRGKVYLHDKCVLLEEVDLRTDFDKGQMALWQDECSGVCGV